jgi:hypothetical protein
MADPYGVQRPAAAGRRSPLPDIEPFFVGGSTAEIGKHRFVATRSRSRAPQALRPVADPELAKAGAWGAAAPMGVGITGLRERPAPMEAPAAIANRPRRRFGIPRPRSGAARPAAGALPALSLGSWIGGASAAIASLSGHVVGAARSMPASGGLQVRATGLGGGGEPGSFGRGGTEPESLADALQALSHLTPDERTALRLHVLSQLDEDERRQLVADQWEALSRLDEDTLRALAQLRTAFGPNATAEDIQFYLYALRLSGSMAGTAFLRLSDAMTAPVPCGGCPPGQSCTCLCASECSRLQCRTDAEIAQHVADAVWGRDHIEHALLTAIVREARHDPRAWPEEIWERALIARGARLDLQWPPCPTPDQPLFRALVDAARRIAGPAATPEYILSFALASLGRATEPELVRLGQAFSDGDIGVVRLASEGSGGGTGGGEQTGPSGDRFGPGSEPGECDNWCKIGRNLERAWKAYKESTEWCVATALVTGWISYLFGWRCKEDGGEPSMPKEPRVPDEPRMSVPSEPPGSEETPTSSEPRRPPVLRPASSPVEPRLQPPTLRTADRIWTMRAPPPPIQQDAATCWMAALASWLQIAGQLAGTVKEIYDLLDGRFSCTDCVHADGSLQPDVVAEVFRSFGFSGTDFSGANDDAKLTYEILREHLRRDGQLILVDQFVDPTYSHVRVVYGVGIDENRQPSRLYMSVMDPIEGAYRNVPINSIRYPATLMYRGSGQVGPPPPCEGRWPRDYDYRVRECGGPP